MGATQRRESNHCLPRGATHRPESSASSRPLFDGEGGGYCSARLASLQCLAPLHTVDPEIAIVALGVAVGLGASTARGDAPVQLRQQVEGHIGPCVVLLVQAISRRSHSSGAQRGQTTEQSRRADTQKPARQANTRCTRTASGTPSQRSTAHPTSAHPSSAQSASPGHTQAHAPGGMAYSRRDACRMPMRGWFARRSRHWLPGASTEESVQM